MKKIAKHLIKLLNFLIRILTKGLAAGTKTLEAIKATADTGSKIAPILIEISEILLILQQKKIALEKLQGEE